MYTKTTLEEQMIATNGANVNATEEKNREKFIIDLAKEKVKLDKESEDTDCPEGFELLPVGKFPVKVSPKNVPDFTIARIQQKYRDPPVPTQYLDSKGREEENPHDPGYLKKIAENSLEKTMALLDSTIMWAVELGAPIPNKEIKKLQTIGALELDADEITIEFIFKRDVLFNNSENVTWLTSKSGLSREAVDEAASKF